MGNDKKNTQNKMTDKFQSLVINKYSPTLALLLILTVMVTGTWWVDRQHEVRIVLNDGYLYGDLIRPANSKNNVLYILIAGSGPTDRDGNSDVLSGKNDSLKALAYALKDQGYASFRYDQRSAGKTRLQTTTDIETITFETMVDDLIKVIQTMKQAEKFDTIILIGHSQGSMVANLAAEQEAVAGYISLCGATRSIDQVLIWQLQQQNLPEFEEIKAVIERLKQGETVDSMSKETAKLLGTGVQKFLISWMVYDPYVEAKKLTIPKLFIFGSEDLQVPSTEAVFLKELSDAGTSRVILGMNHVLKQVKSGDRKANLASYTNPSFVLHPELITAITEFAEGVK